MRGEECIESKQTEREGIESETRKKKVKRIEKKNLAN